MEERTFSQHYNRVSIAVFSTAMSVCLLFLMFGNTSIDLDKSFLLNNFVYAQIIPMEYPFENSTHIQYNAGDEIYPKPSARLILDLVEDPEGISYSGQAYSPVYTSVTYEVNDDGKFKTYWLDLTNSGSNEVSISDTQIYPSFSFRVPMGSNSTVERVNEISQFVTVESIETLPNVVSYSGWNTLPITINGTSYSNVLTIFDQYNNGTAVLYIAAFDNFLNSQT